VKDSEKLTDVNSIVICGDFSLTEGTYFRDYLNVFYSSEGKYEWEGDRGRSP
jgi:hypothetical protein